MSVKSRRKFHVSSIIRDGAYEGDGKTTLSILNKDATYGLMVDSYSEVRSSLNSSNSVTKFNLLFIVSQVGFKLNNGLRIVGPLVIFPKSVLSWKVGGLVDVNEESLSLFTVLEPKLDVLVLGVGSEKRTPEFDKRILHFGNKYKINMEVVPTNQACAVFNFLNAEGRFVGAGLLPPRVLLFSEDEVLNNDKVMEAIDSKANIDIDNK